MSYFPPETTCFAKGTYISTKEGEKLIEEIQPGDLIRILGKEPKPVKWVGRRQEDFTCVPKDAARRNQPILFKKSSVGDMIPYRDLIISASHAVVFHGQVVAAGNLVNNRTIFFLSDIKEITYYHLDLDGFEIIFANGMMGESYVDVGNRSQFDNYSEYNSEPANLTTDEPECLSRKSA
jgi:antigen 43